MHEQCTEVAQKAAGLAISRPGLKALEGPKRPRLPFYMLLGDTLLINWFMMFSHLITVISSGFVGLISSYFLKILFRACRGTPSLFCVRRSPLRGAHARRWFPLILIPLIPAPAQVRI